MSQMHQMQLSYVATEDRMLYRVNTRERQEFRFWMTRRYVAILWHTLTQLLARRPAPAAPASPVEAAPPPPSDPLVEATKQELLHLEAVKQADFKTQYQESNYLPLGEQPILLFSAGLKVAPDGQPLLCMHPEQGQGIEIVLNEQILHSFCQLILDTTAKADWGLKLAFVPGTGPAPEAEGPAKGLN
jgi:hypothetical protein